MPPGIKIVQRRTQYIISNLVVVSKEAQELRQHAHNYRAQNWTHQRSAAAYHNHDDKGHRQVQHKGGRVDVAGVVRIQSAGNGAKNSRQRKGDNFDAGAADATGVDSVDVIAHGKEHTSPTWNE